MISQVPWVLSLGMNKLCSPVVPKRIGHFLQLGYEAGGEHG